jgi:hypothetical protein
LHPAGAAVLKEIVHLRAHIHCCTLEDRAARQRVARG